MNPRFNTLNEWLHWQESLHWTTIDLGLDRIHQVAKKMNLLDVPFTIITVAGTNGKGSSVAMLDAILSAQGYKTGAYTSPYITYYNERIHVAKSEANDQLICDAFQAIDEARGEVSLSYFEFGTLAAIWIFVQQQVDVALLEVGMGGRLDAVNVWDADAALITTVDIDHIKWLGDNREKIGREKAGVMRADKPAISGDPNPPDSIAAVAKNSNAILYQADKDYTWYDYSENWSWNGWDNDFLNLPLPVLAGSFQINNAANVIAVLMSLSSSLKVSRSAIEQGLKETKLSGRLEQLEQIGSQPNVILDATHNPHAAQQLSKWLSETPVEGKTFAIFSMLEDKDISKVVQIMKSEIDHWFIVPLEDERGMAVSTLEQRIIAHESVTNFPLTSCQSVQNAWVLSKKCLNKQDRLVVFGSFLLLSVFKVAYSE